MNIDVRPRLRSAECMHGKMIDDVLTRFGKPSGKVRCLECGATFNDPATGAGLDRQTED